jgi:haloalkane dehalogenase
VNLEKLYPFQSQFSYPPHKHRYHYVDEGRGEVMLMLHGNPTWSFFYRNLIEHFRKTHRVVAPDHIGCGLSDKPSTLAYNYTLEQRVQDIEHLVETLDLKDITLVVHDWGGMIGMGFAVKHPELIKRIVLLNTAAFAKPKAKRLPLSIGICRTPLLGPVLVRGANAFCRGALHRCTVKPIEKSVKKAYLLPYSNWNSRRAVYEFVRDIPLKASDRSYETLDQVQSNLEKLDHIPKLILWGEKDFVFDRHFLAEWQRLWPDADLQTFPNAGHYLLEDDGEAIAKRIERFV